MKKSVFVSSIAIASLLFGTVGVYAGTNLEQISAYLNKGLTFKLKGDTWTAKGSDGKTLYPITYDGSTYLPVRALGEALGVNIGWDDDKQTVLISDDKTVANTAKGLSRSNPAEIGDSVNITIKDYSRNYNVTYRLEQVIRGQESLETARANNSLLEVPKEGYEYILAKVSVKLEHNSNKDAFVDFNRTDFRAVSGSGIEYEYKTVLVDPTYDFNLYEGGSGTGWIGFMVRTDDAQPLITVDRNFDGTGGVWFKTY